MKEAAEKSKDFPWSLNRISQTVNWCKLVRLVSVYRAGHAGMDETQLSVMWL